MIPDKSSSRFKEEFLPQEQGNFNSFLLVWQSRVGGCEPLQIKMIIKSREVNNIIPNDDVFDCSIKLAIIINIFNDLKSPFFTTAPNTTTAILSNLIFSPRNVNNEQNVETCPIEWLEISFKNMPHLFQLICSAH